MDHRTATAAVSRDSLLSLRRVERQQWIIERLHAAAVRVPLGRLAEELGVTERTVARDVQRLRHSGVPLTTTAGRGGGAALSTTTTLRPVDLDLPEIAALLASLAAVGPSISTSAQAATAKLTAALAPDSDPTT